MLNIIRSDLFRIGKGKALLGVMLGILASVILIGVVFKAIGSPGFEVSMMREEVLDESDVEDIKLAQDMMPNNGGEFFAAMCQEMGSAFLFFLLPFIITIFGADYASGTYRNLISYHSKRSGIYAAKMITSVLLTIVMIIGSDIISAVVGGVLFGFGGFNGATIGIAIKSLVFMLPILVSLVGVGHCVLAFTKKTSATIAFYLVGLLVWSMLIQIPAMIFPGMNWLLQLDFNSSIKMAAQYAISGNAPIMVPMIFSFILIAGTCVFGSIRYKTTDFDFN